MALAKVGRRGSLVIPASERRRAGIDEGDRVEVRSEEEGLIIVKKIASLEKVRRKMAGRLPPWSELEGKADELVLQETRKEKHQLESKRAPQARYCQNRKNN